MTTSTRSRRSPLGRLPGFSQPTETTEGPELDPTGLEAAAELEDPVPGNLRAIGQLEGPDAGDRFEDEDPMTPHQRGEPFQPSQSRGLMGRLRESARKAVDRTTSTTGERAGVDPKTATRLMAVVIGGVVLVGAGMARARGASLRRPTEQERDAIAEPLGRILSRWIPLPFGEDLSDLADAGVSVNEYLARGPLIERPRIDPNVPANLQEDPRAS